MPRRTVPLGPADLPAPRQTQVLRAGPPQGQGRRLDLVLGAAGALLLVLAGVLGAVLPERDVVLPQFRASPVDLLGEFPSQGGAVDNQQGTQEFAYDVPADNVHTILVELFFADDVAASLTDTLRVELLDPDGTPVGGERVLASARPDPPDPQGPAGPLAFTAAGNTGRWAFGVATKPDEAILAGRTEHETAREVQARLEAEHFQATAGPWTVRVTLVSAGGCPNPQDADQQQRYLACMLETQGSGEDAGNPFVIEKFEYTSFSLAVEELD